MTDKLELPDASPLQSDCEANPVERYDAQTDMTRLVEHALSRRSFLTGSAALSASTFVVAAGFGKSAQALAASRLDFTGIPANTDDAITVPNGYSWHVVARWGDPLWSKGVPFDGKTMGTAADQALAFGDNTDGMELFTDGKVNILAVNNEYTTVPLSFGYRDSKKPETEDDVRKCMAWQGVSIFEIAQAGGKWEIVKDSKYNRRIMPTTEIEMTGPVRGHEFVKTAADSTGTKVFGTVNNCGAGRTPWGTYLTCEENFNNYFSSSDGEYKPTSEMKRYGITNKESGYNFRNVEERFDISKHPNEVNRFGYVVEIDPMDPTSTPKKRTAMGRFKHENAAVAVARNGQVVVYLGDDERGEFLYKFVSDGKYAEGANNTSLLETGKLYVAKFADDMTGEWIELTPASTGMGSVGEVLVNTRIAASKVKATTMDRPEWVAVNPLKSEAYLCLTNNSQRGSKPNLGGDDTPATGPNPRKGNNYGQIIRWMPEGGDHTASKFKWDFFVLAGNPAVHKDQDLGVGAYAGSKNVTTDNMFNSPDGLKFDSRGILWIQTDGAYSDKDDYAGMGNNQMLAGDPETGEIRRFLVGPRECEVTGITWSPDKKTMFVGIQHPGEKAAGKSHWPDGGESTPRSAVIAITRDDGGIVG